ncbi:MAG: hypothetical protein GX621_13555, partial [Pirellulaceae bacterium]|nr:hypothetical protein [Pirellulaceae bacterium]
WIVVNLKMFEHTGDDAYLDAAEQMLVNHFFMNQFHTGGFGHLGFDHKIVGGKKWQGWDGRFGSENPGCCSLWGQWALGQSGRYVVTCDGQTVLVNLYVEADVELPSHGIRLTIESDFPRMRRAKITVRREGEGEVEETGERAGDRAGEFDLALRVPSWARRVRVECAGQRVEREPDKGRVVLRRDWAGHEVVLVEFIASPRFVSWPKNEPLGVAVFDGPLCLGLSSAEVDVDRRWTIERDARGNPSLDEQGRPTAVDASDGRAAALRPIGDDWLVPDTRDPRRYRVLFN